MSARPQVFVAGAPSFIGGATTELDHLLDLFLNHGVDAHVVPTSAVDDLAVRDLRARGCTVHRYDPAIFADKVVVSFCNVDFLRRLPEIVEAGRPRRTVWFNCNNWMLAGEADAHAQGWIDLFGFVSEYQRARLRPQLQRFGPVRSFAYRPFLNLRRIAFLPRPIDATIHVGRVSRDDAAKYPADTWEMFRRIRVPAGKRKHISMLGFGPAATAKVGPPPPGLAVSLFPPGAIPARRLYAGLDLFLYKTGGWSESYCRVVVEAQAHGVPVIVPRDYAFPELVDDRRTGMLATSSGEMSELASWLAHHPRHRLRIAWRARAALERKMDDAACWAPWPEVLA